MSDEPRVNCILYPKCAKPLVKEVARLQAYISKFHAIQREVLTPEGFEKLMALLEAE
jgi:hypothetical protein